MADRSDAGVLALLIVDGILTGAVGLAFTPLYLGAVPVPLGVVLSVLVLPWLVLRAGEIDRRFAGAPVFASRPACGCPTARSPLRASRAMSPSPEVRMRRGPAHEVG